ncbi:hypothetical protein, partial [Escherichia coli]|uniref:hypothetical protein n=1 Tax=Escherichia coli TaxID=562 RepID=UPI001F246F92
TAPGVSGLSSGGVGGYSLRLLWPGLADKKRPVIGALSHFGSSPAAGTPATLTFSRNPCSARPH